MSNIFLPTMAPEGVNDRRPAQLQAQGLIDGLNIIYDSRLGSWTPRPTATIYALPTTVQVGTVTLGATESLYGNDFLLSLQAGGASTSRWGILYDLSTGTGYSEVQYATTSGFIPYPWLTRVPGSVPLLMYRDVVGGSLQASKGTVQLINPVANEQLTCAPLYAFGRVWYATKQTAFTGGKLRWADANITTLSGVATGSLDIPEGDILGIHEISRRLVLFTTRGVVLLGSASGGSPIDPNSAGGIIVLDRLSGVNCAAAGASLSVADSVYYFSRLGLGRLTVDSFSNKPALDEWDSQTSGHLIRTAFNKVIENLPSLIQVNMVYLPHLNSILTRVIDANGGCSTLLTNLLTSLHGTVNWSRSFTYAVAGTRRGLVELRSGGVLASYDLPGQPTTSWSGITSTGIEPPFESRAEFGYISDQNLTSSIAPKWFIPAYWISQGTNPSPSPSRTFKLVYRTAEVRKDACTSLVSGLVMGDYLQPGQSRPLGQKIIGHCVGSGPNLALGWQLNDARNIQIVLDGFSVQFSKLYANKQQAK